MPGRLACCLEGEEESMAVEELGTGVGYLKSSKASRLLLPGLGSAGEDDNGSNAGKREAFAFGGDGSVGGGTVPSA